MLSWRSRPGVLRRGLFRRAAGGRLGRGSDRRARISWRRSAPTGRRSTGCWARLQRRLEVDARSGEVVASPGGAALGRRRQALAGPGGAGAGLPG